MQISRDAIKKVGDQSVLDDETEIDVAFSIRDALSALPNDDARFRALSWVAGSFDLAVQEAHPAAEG